MTTAEKTFTVYWNRPYVDQWKAELGYFQNRPVAALEIGVFEAYTTVWLMENLLTHPDSTILAIDPWKLIDRRPRGNPVEIYERARANTAEYGDRVRLVRGSADVVLAQMWEENRKRRFDFAFIDGRHTAINVLLDAANTWRLLRVGGVAIFDDFKGGVRQAARSFVELFPHEVVWESKRQLCVRKTGTEGE